MGLLRRLWKSIDDDPVQQKAMQIPCMFLVLAAGILLVCGLLTLVPAITQWIANR